MARYLIRVRPELREDVKGKLPAGASVVEQVFDYITVELPEELVPQVRRILGVVEVRPEVEKRIAQRWPVEKKLAKFMEFAQNPLTLLQAIAFSLEADAEKVRWPTEESRKVLGADRAEYEGYTGKGIKIGVIDTGIDPTCGQTPGLTGVSTVEGQPLFIDENGHGTHCATTVAGGSFPTPWGALKGVAPDAELFISKCLGYGMGAGTETSVLRSMMDCFQAGCDIISMSLGSSYTEESAERIPECRAIKMLTDQGVIVVVANGNDGPDPRTVGVPANSPFALSVGAIDIEGKIADFSSRGPTYDDVIKPDVVAPGVDILSSTATASMIDNMQFMDGPRLACISGTSMATPGCAGIVALIKQLYLEEGFNLTTNMIKDTMARYGQPKTNDYGWGLLTWQIARKYLEEVLKPRPPAVPAVPPEEEEAIPPEELVQVD